MKHEHDLRIRFEPDGIVVNAELGATVFKIAKKVGVGLRSECGGKGNCGKCLIRSTTYNVLSPPTQREKDLLGEHNLDIGLRLACQTRIQGSGVIEIPKEAQIRDRKLQETGRGRPISIDPSYIKVLVDVKEPSLEDQRSDFQRIIAAIEEIAKVDKISMDPSLLSIPPKVFRENRWKLIATLQDRKKIVELLPKIGSPEILGLAVDLGTSKIVIHLVDLITGSTIGILADENPQLPYGEDIITRIQFAQETAKNQAILREKVVTSINSMIEQLVRQTNHNLMDIYSLMLVGNTAQLHLFMGSDPKYLARSPYVSLFSGSVTVSSDFSGIHINPAGTITLFPSVGGFVGADCVAVVLATGIAETEELCLAVDIGTNTEIVLGNRERMTVVSCASGPAFEGIHIRHGMKAVEGAIEHVKISPSTFEVEFEVIGNIPPVGLCGSAMIDCIAELLKTGLIDFRGRLNSTIDSPFLVGEGKNRQCVIASAKESGIGTPIVITQADIRNLQLAKAAILTGGLTLLRLAGVETTTVKHVYLAGAFGNQVNPQNTTIMGLLPEFPLEKLEFVGNAAIEGAKRALLSRSEFAKVEKFVSRMKHYELASDKEFEKEYTDALFFPHRDPKKFPSVMEMLPDHVN